MKKKKTPSMNRSDDLQSTYLQQFQCYLLPLIPLKKKTAICQLPQPSQPNYNPVHSLEEQIHQEADQEEVDQEEDPQVEEEEEEELQVVEEAPHEEEEMLRQPLCWKESPWEHYQ